ncbi:MAG: hypothetical protein U5N58_08510 [Actinomycetota bacterium]|nr:hypothetical protein [Actinomycetota bacterium]
MKKKYSRFGFLDRDKMNKAAIGVLSNIGSKIDTKSPMRNLSVGDKQMVMIAHALLRSKNYDL